MFDFNGWIETFKNHYKEHGQAYNDAANMASLDSPSYQVAIQKPRNPTWRVLGVHHLLPEENRGNHNVYIEMLCKQGEREGFRAIHWTWIGRQPNQPARDVFAGQKPHNELVDLSLNLGMIVSVWTQGSEVVFGLSSNHPDELGPNGEKWNSIGHHSFFVCFEEIDLDDPDPDPPDPDPPDPGPKETVMLVKKSWLDQQEIDEDGFIRIKS